ncbi:hypothetical protein AJ80_06616 [Polytolypa hystricis UAMH7299]|uniref:Uncharacterized protein n=1 Tax=Polytolypa hystricis (strain UAMH7299) TaxID=1447883 RepID=A0A2B7XV76_POLH7|nr:hypothetical protein AJ80_06616 [Polytolypa hystricis UAMH7299]
MARPVSIFGLGDMGAALASTFLKHCYKTTVWNRTSSKVKPLVDNGASLATSVAQGAEASELIIICLLDNNAVQQTLEQAQSSWSGRTIVNLTNGTPSHARETAKWAIARGARYIHGGIMAVPPMIGNPGAFLLYSGASEAFEPMKIDLDILGESKYVGSDVGLASLQDLALLSGMYGLFTGYTHAMALVRSENIKGAVFFPLLHTWLTAMAGYLSVVTQQVDSGDYAATGSNLEMQLAGLNNIVELSKEQGVNADLIRPFKALVERHVAAGKGAEDTSALVELAMKPVKE